MLQTTTLQKTLAKSVTCIGLGLHGGERVEMTLHPADVGHGLAFVRRTSGKNGYVAASWENVRKNRLQTVLGNEDGVEIGTVEHILAALVGLGIDNALVEVSADEVPAMDGSAAFFCKMIREAGIVLQNEPAEFLDLDALPNKRVSLAGRGKMSIRPALGLTISYTIDFANPHIGNQSFVYHHKSSADFALNIAPARTFCMEEDIPRMRRNGFAVGGSLESAVVFSKDGILNHGGLHFNNEPVRHKILDCLGDLALAGKRINGAVSVVKGGHGVHTFFLQNLIGGRKGAKAPAKSAAKAPSMKSPGLESRAAKSQVAAAV